MISLSFFVPGTPVPQGSKTGFSPKGSNRVSLVDANKTALKPWRAAVTRAAEATRLDHPQMTGPVRVEAVFVFARPASVKRRFPSVKPDLDKLVRALFDGLTDSGMWKDDGQGVRLVAEKLYGTAPGVHVTVTEMSVDQPTRGEQLLAEREQLLAEMGMSR